MGHNARPMATRQTAPIHIAAVPDRTPLSAQQKKFNALIKRITTQRGQLQDWGVAVTAYRERHAHELRPLLDEYRTLNIELVHLLDGMAARKLTKGERALLHELIAGMAGDLAEQVRDDATREALRTLYNRYAPSDYDAEQAEQEAEFDRLTRDVARNLFGVDMEGVDLDSPEEVARRVEEQMQARQQRAEEQRAAHQTRRSKKPGVREQRRQQAAQQASQSLREIYRKLASSLHPDRESDPAERERKTALMQRANQAYDAGNLLELLELQWQAEQIDPARIASFSDERLTHYNHVLAEQLDGLQRQVSDTAMAFAAEFGLSPMRHYQPAKLMALLRAQIQELQLDMHELRLFLRDLRDDPAELKRWLKRERAMARHRQEWDLLPPQLLDDLFR